MLFGETMVVGSLLVGIVRTTRLSKESPTTHSFVVQRRPKKERLKIRRAHATTVSDISPVQRVSGSQLPYKVEAIAFRRPLLLG